MNYQCPFCNEYFKPMRLNQLFCCKKHSWSFRNRLKSTLDLSRKSFLLASLENLKILTRLQVSQEGVNTNKEELIYHGFDLEGMKDESFIEKGNKNGFKWFTVFGFPILWMDDEDIVIYQPESIPALNKYLIKDPEQS